MKDEELKKQMPIGGDVPALQLQYDHCKVGWLSLGDIFNLILSTTSNEVLKKYQTLLSVFRHFS